jgi:hypothetical protein
MSSEVVAGAAGDARAVGEGGEKAAEVDGSSFIAASGAQYACSWRTGGPGRYQPIYPDDSPYESSKWYAHATWNYHHEVVVRRKQFLGNFEADDQRMARNLYGMTSSPVRNRGDAGAIRTAPVKPEA